MDLGYTDQVLWEISQGHWWAFSSVFQSPALAVDGSLWLYPLAYGFRFLGGSYFLFGVQAVATGITAWGLYRIARLGKLSNWQSTLISTAFLLYPGIIGGSQFDFHPDFMALPFVIWSYFYYRIGNKPVYYLFLLMAILAKDVVLISVAGWGVGLIVWERRLKDGLIAIVLSMSFLMGELLWIFPAYFPGANQSTIINLYGYLGHSVTGIMVGVFTHFPVVLRHLSHDGPYTLWIFGPVLAICLIGSAGVPAMLALFLLNAISSFPSQRVMTDQYQVILGGWLFIALIEALRRFGDHARNLLIFTVLLSTTLLEGAFLAADIAPELAVHNNVVTSVKSALRHVSKQDVLYTQNHLGLWAYRYPLTGIAMDQAPGHLVDPLPLLWSEASKAKRVPTAVLGRRPVSPYLADIIAQAEGTHYRVSYHHANLFVVTGNHKFSVPKPSGVWGWEPANATWNIPLWTQLLANGTVNWQAQNVLVAQGKPGPVLSNLPLIFYPGRYRVSVQFTQSRELLKGAILGFLRVGREKTPLVAKTSSTSLFLTIHHRQELSLSLVTTGRYAFAVGNLQIVRR